MKLTDQLSRAFGALATALVPLLFFLPAVFLELRIDDSFKVNPEVLIVVGGGLFSVLVALSRSLGGRPVLGGGSPSRSRWFLGAATLWVAVTAYFAYNPQSAWPYAATFATYLLVGQSLLDWMEDAPGRRRILLISLGVLAGFEAFVGLAQLLKWPLVQWAEAISAVNVAGKPFPGSGWANDFLRSINAGTNRGAVIGTLGNPNYLGELLVLLLPIIVSGLALLERLWAKVLVGLVAMLVAGVLLGTAARAATAGLVAAGLVSAFLVWGVQAFNLMGVWKSPRGRIGVALGTMALSVLLIFAGGKIADKLDNLAGGGDSSVGSRLVNWQVALSLTAERPINGFGIGNFKLVNSQKLEKIHPEGVPAVAGTSRFLQAHNEPLQVLAEQGVVGGLLFLGALILWIRETLANEAVAKSLRFSLIWGVGAVLASSLFGFPFHIPLTALAMVAVLPLGIARDTSAEEPVVAQVWRPVYALVVVALLGAFAYQVAIKDAVPNYQAHRYHYVGQMLSKQDDSSDTTITVLSLAAREQRFKAEPLYWKMRALVLTDKSDEALTLYEQSSREGLGYDALFWKGRALEKLGRKQEAYEVYKRVDLLFAEGTPYHKRTKRILKRLEAELQKETPKVSNKR